MKTHNDSKTEEQISQCLELLKSTLGQDLLGVYLYGSAVTDGLKAYSDLDLFVISKREILGEERKKLVYELLKISGIYKKSEKRPIELFIVVKSEVNPWVYPPSFDFQYGDWLREDFEGGNLEPCQSKEMPDLAILVTQLLLANKILFGAPVDELLVKVPYGDVLKATEEALDELMANIEDDTRNVLLTYARMWAMLMTEAIHSKAEAALWVLRKLPENCKPVMKKARAAYLGEEKDSWEGEEETVRACADYMKKEIEKRLIFLKL